MQKLIRTAAIIATALAALSMILLIMTVPLQQFLAVNVFGAHRSMADYLPQFPVLPFLLCMLRAGCIALLIICCGNKKGGIWLEILVFVALVAAVPVISSVASTLQTAIVGSYSGAALAANSYVNTIANFCLSPANWGQAIAYAACGMSIVYKKINRE